MPPTPARTTFPRSGLRPSRGLRAVELASAAAAVVAPAALASAGAPQLALGALAGSGVLAVVAGALHAAREQPLERAPFVGVRSSLRVEVDEQVEALRAAPHPPRAVVDREPHGAAPDALVVTEIEVGGRLGPAQHDARYTVNLVLGDRIVRVGRFATDVEADDLAAELAGALSLGAHAVRRVVDPGLGAGAHSSPAVIAAVATGWWLVAVLCVHTGTGALPRSLALAGGIAAALALAAQGFVALMLAPRVARHVQRVYGVAGRRPWRDGMATALPVAVAMALVVAHRRETRVPGGAPWAPGREPCLVDIDGDGRADLVGASDGHLVAVDATRGKELWKSDAPVDGDLDLACTDDSIVAITSIRSGYGRRAWVRPIDPRTGEVAWRGEVSGAVYATASHGDCLAVAVRDQDFWSTWDATSGAPCPAYPPPDTGERRERWRFDAALASRQRMVERGYSPTLQVSKVRWTWRGEPRMRLEPSFEVSALNPDGDLFWHTTVRGAPAGEQPLQLVDWMLVVVTSLDPGSELRVTALDLDHGKERWAHVYRSRSGGQAAPLLIPQATTTVIGWADRLWALDGRTGRTAWVYGG